MAEPGNAPGICPSCTVLRRSAPRRSFKRFGRYYLGTKHEKEWNKHEKTFNRNDRPVAGGAGVHRDWPDGKGVGISCVDSSSAYLYRVIHTRYLQLTFKRVDASVAETTLTAEWDVDLAGPWSSVPINETTAGTYSYAKGVTVKVAEKLSAIQTIDIISERAKGASRSAFLHAMSLVPRGEILEGDEPRPKQRRTRRPS